MRVSDRRMVGVEIDTFTQIFSNPVLDLQYDVSSSSVEPVVVSSAVDW